MVRFICSQFLGAQIYVCCARNFSSQDLYKFCDIFAKRVIFLFRKIPRKIQIFVSREVVTKVHHIFAKVLADFLVFSYLDKIYAGVVALHENVLQELTQRNSFFRAGNCKYLNISRTSKKGILV